MWRMIGRAARLVLVSVLGLALALVAGCVGARAWRHHEIARATAIDPAKGIDQTVFVNVGGVLQWVRIRGQDRSNPVLLMLHGGPGIATSPFPATTLYPLTRDFTVVQWDQRGAGKTYSRSGAVGANVTLDRMAQDGIEVAQFAARQLGKPKVIVLGHSWGSMLAVRMVKARPDLFYAYVGTGQAVNQGVSKAIAYRQLLAEARARGDSKALAELQAIGSPPYATTAKASVHTRWANSYEPGNRRPIEQIPMILLDSDAGLFDIRDYMQGISSSQDHFRDQVNADDLRALGPEFQVPVFVFQGARDNVTPIAPVKAWFDAIQAPHKELALIPDAGHNALFTRQPQFLALLVERVRPLAVAG